MSAISDIISEARHAEGCSAAHNFPDGTPGYRCKCLLAERKAEAGAELERLHGCEAVLERYCGDPANPSARTLTDAEIEAARTSRICEPTVNTILKLRSAVAAEQEAIAKVCESFARDTEHQSVTPRTACEILASIVRLRIRATLKGTP